MYKIVSCLSFVIIRYNSIIAYWNIVCSTTGPKSDEDERTWIGSYLLRHQTRSFWHFSASNSPQEQSHGNDGTNVFDIQMSYKSCLIIHLTLTQWLNNVVVVACMNKQ